MQKSNKTAAEAAFQKERTARLASRPDSKLDEIARAFLRKSTAAKYSYNFDWMGRPIIQLPQDIIAVQEIIMSTKPDLIIETGIAHGGSLIFSASMLALLDLADGATLAEPAQSSENHRKVIGIDIDIRPHNRDALEVHPLFSKVELLQGSSIDKDIVARVVETSRMHKRIMVCLDSHHTHDHVLTELNLYAPLVSPGCYCVVFDTLIEQMPDSFYPDRSWGKGNNPATAVKEFVKNLENEKVPAEDGGRLLFESDAEIDNKLLVSMNPGGYLKRCLPEE